VVEPADTRVNATAATPVWVAQALENPILAAALRRRPEPASL